MQQKKHCPGASRSTDIMCCLFSVFIIFKITSPNFCLGDYQMRSQNGTCSVRLRLLSCLMLKSSRWLWKNHARHMLKVWSMPAPEAQKLVWMKRRCRQQEELRINQRISKVKKLNKYSMDQRTSYATGSCNSSAPHWIITRGKKAEPGLNEIFLIQPTFPFPGLCYKNF